MIVRHSFKLRTTAASALLHRVPFSSPLLLSLNYSTRHDKSGSRFTRTASKSVASRRQRRPQDELIPAASEEHSPPPAPVASSSSSTPNFPYASYNQSPPSTSTDVTPTSNSETEANTLPVASIPVNVPYDPQGVIDNDDAADRARALFATPAIVVVRQLEMMNLFLGFEQANKYQLLSPEGTLLGYLMEEDLGFTSAMTRQVLRTHRAFKATVLDTEGNTVLIIRRPFSWINSRIFISLPSPEGGSEATEKVIGEAQQEWHVYRRKYSHFVKRDGEMQQFAAMDSGFLAWDFEVRDEKNEVIGSVNRNFAGFGRELFTDTGQYVLRFEGVVQGLLDAPQSNEALLAPSDASSSTPSTSAPLKIETKEEGPSKSLLVTPTTSSVDDTISSVPAVIPIPAITYDQRAVMLASAVSIDFDYFSRQRGGIGAGGLWMPMPMGGTSSTDAGAAGAEAGELEGAASESGIPESEPLPTSEGSASEEGGGNWWESGNRDSGGWSEETMKDPWGQSQQEEGGTWSWGDLFPNGDE